MHHFLRRSLLLSFTATLACAALTGRADAQAARATAEAPTFDDLPSPTTSPGSKDKSTKPNDWLEVEAKIKVELAPQPPTKVCPRLTVKWYVAVKNPEKSGSFYLLTRDVEHVNVPLNEDVYTSVYLSPASLRRLTGSSRGGKNAVELVGYEVLYNGQKIAEQTNKQRPGWWNVASDKISRTDTVPLLTKNETPFSIFWWDRYAEVQAEQRR